MALELQCWANYTNGKIKMQRQSAAYVKNDRVLRFTEDEECNCYIGNVQSSYQNTSYNVKVFLDGCDVSFSSCTCALGLYECAHVAALLLFGYKCAVKTDVRQRWLQKPKSAPKQVLTIDDMYAMKNANYNPFTTEVTAGDKEYLYARLSLLGRFTACHWMMMPEPAVLPERQPIPGVQELLDSPEYLYAGDKQQWLREKLMMSPEQIASVASDTKGQRQNVLWASARKLRITASNFGKVVRAIERNSYPPSLKKTLLATYNLQTVRSVAWGLIHEKTAIKAYCDLGAEVEETGLWLHDSGCLGASPDGLITKPPTVPVYHQQEGSVTGPKIIEVKCPYSARDLTLVEAAKTIKDFFLVFNENNQKLALKMTHPYYHQVQGQLHLTGTGCADFVVWTKKDLQVVRIVKDKSWTQNLNKLEEFYFEKFIPSLTA